MIPCTLGTHLVLTVMLSWSPSTTDWESLGSFTQLMKGWKMVRKLNGEINQWRIQDFPEVGRQHTILPNFPKNCMTLKKFGPGRARGTRAPLDPPMKLAHFAKNFFTFSFHFKLRPVVIPFSLN